MLPVYYRGYEKHGLLFGIRKDGCGIGAQCGNCHTTIWTDGWHDPVLNESYPENLPDSGPEYRAYHSEKIQRFLWSLPNCPKCHQQAYDLFVNGADRMRFEDGTSVPQNVNNMEVIEVDPSTINIWWYEP